MAAPASARSPRMRDGLVYGVRALGFRLWAFGQVKSHEPSRLLKKEPKGDRHDDPRVLPCSYSRREQRDAWSR
jgi:hypothetical protein